MKKIKSLFLKLYLVLSVFLSNQIVYASGDGGELAKSVVVTGTRKLLQDVTFAFLLLIPSSAVVVILWMSIKYHYTEDDGEDKPIKKKIRRVIIITIFAFVIDGLIHLILRYYGVQS